MDLVLGCPALLFQRRLSPHSRDTSASHVPFVEGGRRWKSRRTELKESHDDN